MSLCTKYSDYITSKDVIFKSREIGHTLSSLFIKKKDEAHFTHNKEKKIFKLCTSFKCNMDNAVKMTSIKHRQKRVLVFIRGTGVIYQVTLLS